MVIEYAINFVPVSISIAVHAVAHVFNPAQLPPHDDANTIPLAGDVISYFVTGQLAISVVKNPSKDESVVVPTAVR